MVCAIASLGEYALASVGERTRGAAYAAFLRRSLREIGQRRPSVITFPVVASVQ
jgi:hypothetical protein